MFKVAAGIIALFSILYMYGAAKSIFATKTTFTVESLDGADSESLKLIDCEYKVQTDKGLIYVYKELFSSLEIGKEYNKSFETVDDRTVVRSKSSDYISIFISIGLIFLVLFIYKLGQLPTMEVIESDGGMKKYFNENLRSSVHILSLFPALFLGYFSFQLLFPFITKVLPTWDTTQAKVTDTVFKLSKRTSGSNRSETRFLIYEYEVDGEVYIDKKKTFSEDINPESIISVNYNIKMPSQSQSEMNMSVPLGAAIFISTLFTLISCLIFVFTRKI